MSEPHFKSYGVQVRWTGNLGTGTSAYRDYSREHEVSIDGKPTFSCSSDPDYRGNPSLPNPEELFVASISACHMLWYLHLCADAGIVVTGYEDAARAEMAEAADGSGHFRRVDLHPSVTITSGDPLEAAALHGDAHERCFISNSLNVPVAVVPVIHAPGSVTPSGGGRSGLPH
jgi:organic hydroperoxide reductase OsmC/OhrA